jgi:hypothetical protein
VDDSLKGKIKTAAVTVAGLATGGVVFGLVGATVIGGAVCWLSYRRWLRPRQGANNTPPSSNPTALV